MDPLAPMAAWCRRGFMVATALLAVHGVQAQTEPLNAWPSKPVKLIVPFAPGGPTDTVARLVAERLQAMWKQPVVIDYKAGGGTTVGTTTVVKSTADGYTLGMAISALMINPALQPALPYDTLKDLTGVSQIAVAHYGLFAHPSAPYNTVAELVAYAKKNPDQVSYATPGIGTGTHLAGELLSANAGVHMSHVPYRGSAPAQQDVLAGRVPLLFDVAYSAMPFVRDKRLKLLALASPKRSSSMPDAPLIQDTVPGVAGMSIIGVIAPSATPRELVRRIGADIATAVRSPEVVERMGQLGMEPVGSTPDEYNALIRSELDKWAKVVKSAGIKLE